MTWQQKVEMVRLSNQGKQREMQNFVEPLIETMDIQAQDMLINCIDLVPENISQNKPFFKKLRNYFGEIEAKFGLRTSLRIEYFKLLNDQAQL